MKNLKTVPRDHLAWAFGIATFMGWAASDAGLIVGIAMFTGLLAFMVLCLLAR